VRWTLGDLREFLELVVEHSGATTIHLLAHSMGNRALTEALGRVGLGTGRSGGPIVNELVLTAPDIDTDTFVRDLAPAIMPTAKRVTLYASSRDKALAFSKKVHGYDRAGESGGKIVLVDGVETIDVSAVDTNFVGHFYYGENKSVLSDIFNLLQGQPASKRFGLKHRTKGKRLYWVFRP
jgi:esterase/lipase superfamily enzyme